MAYVITTVSGTLSLKKLGYRILIVHPATVDLTALGFSDIEIDNSEEIQSALQAGTITADFNGNPVIFGVNVTPPARHKSSHTDGTDDIQTASGSQKGLLSSTDWSTFNSKVTSNSPITPGTNTKLTYDAKGLVTAGTAAILASSDYSNQGTTTTVLHGNAAGSPTWAQIADAVIAAHTSTKITITAKPQLNAQIVYTDQANTFGSFNQIFPSERLQIRNPANSFSYIFQGSAITADRVLTLPLTAQTEILAVRPQIVESSPANPTGTNSNVGVMMGLAVAFTPRVTGRIKVTIDGLYAATNAGSQVAIGLRFGTGGSPANGAALTGTLVTPEPNYYIAQSNEPMSFSFSRIIDSLVIGTPIWIDINVRRGGNNSTCTVSSLNIIVEEK